VTGTCKHRNEHLGSMKVKKCIDYQLLKHNSAPQLFSIKLNVTLHTVAFLPKIDIMSNNIHHVYEGTVSTCLSRML
jgi:hypothetical protein